jgi:hypothetical protein
MIRAVHVPHCNPRCRGDDHWLEDDVTEHEHEPDQRDVCEACREVAA